MQELTFAEVEAVSGGNAVVAWVAGVVGGVVGNYIYESLGGAAGIERGINGMIPRRPEKTYEWQQ